MTVMTGYPDMPEPRFLNVNGIRMAVYEAGPADGRPVVLCHGFPELAYSWRHQLKGLGEAGFRVIAPDMRGYGFTSAPEAVEAYDIHHLTGDLIGLLDTLGLQRAVFAGHDWGGLVVWQMPLLHRPRVAGVIGLNTPFIPRLRDDPVKLMRAAYGDEMYIVFFQRPDEPEALLERDVARSFRFFMRKPDAPTLNEGKRTGAARFAAVDDDEADWGGTLVLSETELGVYIDTFARTGFRGGINWYRNYTRNWATTEHLRQHVPHPALMITAERDAALPPSMAEGMERYVPDLETHMIEDCGHWTQQEHPDTVNRLVIDWLNRRFAIKH